MYTSGIYAKGWLQSGRYRIPLLAAIAALVMAAPVAGLFCWQWAGPSEPSHNGARMISESPPLAARTSASSSLLWPSRSAAAGSPSSLRNALEGAAGNPFAARAQASWMSARVDPFYEALVSGISEGTLAVRDRSRGVSTFGPPIPARSPAALSDKAILREIQMGVGGSFSSFLENVFGKERKDASEAVDSGEHNPFAKAVDNTPAGAVDEIVAADSKTPRATEPEPSQSENPAPVEPDPTTPAPARIVTTVRPDIMLHIDEEGNLHAVPAARLNENTFESAELGIQEFNVVSFTNPAETLTAIAVADFNLDRIPDVGFVDAGAGVLRLLYGSPGGEYLEGLRIDVGTGARSLAAGDFNGDGRPDMALSNVGVGMLTYFFLGDTEEDHSYRSLWIDRYRDYVAASNPAGSAFANLFGMNFANVAEVLDSPGAGGPASAERFAYSPALDYTISTFSGRQVELNAVLMGSNLSVNLQNIQRQFANVLNIHGVSNMYIVIGDLRYNNTVSVALATPRR